MKREHIIIIGGGVGGYTLALELAEKSKYEITLIEKQYIGGTCLNVGCIPSKSFIYQSTRTKNITTIYDKTQEIIKNLQNGIKQQIISKKIKYIKDEAEITNTNEITLKSNKQTINFDKLVLAIGSKPNIPGFFSNIKDTNKDDKEIISSDDMFSLKNIPEDVVIIGAGYIGIEFACIFNDLGSDVTIIEQQKSILTGLDKELSNELLKSLINKGINIFAGVKINKIEENVIYLNTGDEVLYEKMFLATGRNLNMISSNPKLTFETENGFLKVNDKFETSQKNIFAIGDCISSGPMLAHKAEYDAKLLSKQLENTKIKSKLIKSKMKPDYDKIPFCLFSSPSIGSVGSFKKAARIIKSPFSLVGKAYCNESSQGFLKIGLDKKNRVIAGSVINNNANEILSMLTIIVNQEMSVEELDEIVFMHPTSAEIIKEIIKKAKIQNNDL